MVIHYDVCRAGFFTHCVSISYNNCIIHTMCKNAARQILRCEAQVLCFYYASMKMINASVLIEK